MITIHLYDQDGAVVGSAIAPADATIVHGTDNHFYEKVKGSDGFVQVDPPKVHVTLSTIQD